jgi:hypothetical protein
MLEINITAGKNATIQQTLDRHAIPIQPQPAIIPVTKKNVQCLVAKWIICTNQVRMCWNATHKLNVRDSFGVLSLGFSGVR